MSRSLEKSSTLINLRRCDSGSNRSSIPFEASLNTISAVNGCYELVIQTRTQTAATRINISTYFSTRIGTQRSCISVFIYLVAVLEFDDRYKCSLVSKEADNIPQRRAYDYNESTIGDFVSIHRVKKIRSPQSSQVKLGSYEPRRV